MSLDVKTPKRHINTFALGQVEGIVAKITAAKAESVLLASAPLLVLYKEVVVSPMNATIVVNPKSIRRLLKLSATGGSGELKPKKSSGHMKALPGTTSPPPATGLGSSELPPSLLKYLPGSLDANTEVCYTLQSEEDVKWIVRDVLVSLHQLHSTVGVVHGHLSRDVVRVLMVPVKDRHQEEKPLAESASFSFVPRAVLLDCVTNSCTYVNNTKPWRRHTRLAAPEIIDRQAYGFAADVWGIGALTLDLISILKERCTADKSTKRVAAGGGVSAQLESSLPALDTCAIREGGLLIPEMSMLSGRAQSFVLPCLKLDPLSRPSILQLLTHPFIEHSGPSTKAQQGNHTDPRHDLSETDDDEEEAEDSSDDEESDADDEDEDTEESESESD